MRLRHFWPLAERGDIGDQPLQLPLVEDDRLAPRLQADVLQRHVARAQVEVGRQRADALQRRRQPELLPRHALRPGADHPGGSDAAARDAVAGDAVLPEEAVAELLVAGCRGGRRPHERAEQQPDPLQDLEPPQAHARAESRVPITAIVRTLTASQYQAIAWTAWIRYLVKPRASFPSSHRLKRTPSKTWAWSAPSNV